LIIPDLGALETPFTRGRFNSGFRVENHSRGGVIFYEFELILH